MEVGLSLDKYTKIIQILFETGSAKLGWTPFKNGLFDEISGTSFLN